MNVIEIWPIAIRLLSVISKESIELAIGNETVVAAISFWSVLSIDLEVKYSQDKEAANDV